MNPRTGRKLQIRLRRRLEYRLKYALGLPKLVHIGPVRRPPHEGRWRYDRDLRVHELVQRVDGRKARVGFRDLLQAREFGEAVGEQDGDARAPKHARLVVSPVVAGVGVPL